MAENVATLRCIRNHVIKYQNSSYLKFVFPALYIELLVFMAYLIFTSGSIHNAELKITCISFTVAVAIIVTISYIQMKRLNDKLNQVRSLIFDSGIFEKEEWTDNERSTAVDYARDSMTYMRIITIAYVIAVINLFCLSVLISGIIS